MADINRLERAEWPIFDLKLSQVLQGEFQIKRLNLMLVFQVNCPGCFVYALPLAARLCDVYGDRLNILGLSTAFEDFGLNTLENTRHLLETGEVVGMTKLYFQHHGQTSYSVPIRFPVAFDLLEDEGAKSHSAEGHRYSASVLSAAGYTFHTNRLRGTPSWIVFDENFRILLEWFGHRSESEVQQILDQLLAANSIYDSNAQPV